MKIACPHCGANKVTPAGLCGKCMRFGSPVMEAAAKAAGVVDTWSKSKREYARRITELNQSTDREIDAVLFDGQTRGTEMTPEQMEAQLLRQAQTIGDMRTVLQDLEFSALGKCPVCAGWNMSRRGETPGKHTKNCKLAAVLSHR